MSKIDELKEAMKAEKEVIKKDSSYGKFFSIGGGGVVNFFGLSKAGKTRICITLAIDAANQGLSVVYDDVERNIHPIAVEKMKESGVDYRVHDGISGVRKEIKRMMKGSDDKDVDLRIIDSLTQEITGIWGDEAKSMKVKLDLVSSVQNIAHMMSKWCADNDTMSIIVTQPTSTIGGRKRNAPMGDKLEYFCKEIFFVRRPDEDRPLKGEIIAWGSRILPPNTIVSKYTTKKIGVKFDWFNSFLKELS